MTHSKNRISKELSENKAPANIKYHSGFVSGLEVLLWPYRKQIVIETEKWLSTEGIRMDVLILKKDPAVEIDYDICRIFQAHNILEYKRPDDQLNIDVFAKVMAYAHLYKSQNVSVDSITYHEISATIYRHIYPKKVFRRLHEYGATIEQQYPGVYYVSGISPFPVQILVGKQLNPKEYAMLRVLTPNADDEDIRNFKNMSIKNREASYQKSVDNVLQVSVSLNKESYVRLMKEEPEMCEALRDLMKEDFEKVRQESEANGESNMLVKLVKKGRLTAKEAAEELNISVEDFDEKYLNPVSL